jgi:pilus assembly protein CpaD
MTSTDRFPVRRLATACGLGLLLAGCAFPKYDYSLVPDASVIQVQLQDGRWVAVPPECARLYTEAPRAAYDSRPQAAFGCATYTNLANSVARPQDLLAPHEYAGQQADTAADAVTRYREDKVTPLRETNSTKKSSNK